ncbi:hypothetical protein JOD48_002940 [Oerskovia paurometabola]|nr:hypothetical protein [Oerskovia paurometabola]
MATRRSPFTDQPAVATVAPASVIDESREP